MATVLGTYFLGIVFGVILPFLLFVDHISFSKLSSNSTGISNPVRFEFKLVFTVGVFSVVMSTRVGRLLKTRSRVRSNWPKHRFVSVAKNATHRLFATHAWE